MEWNGLSLEGGSERRKRKEERKKNLGNFNFGNALVVYAELGSRVIIVYLLIP